MLETGNLDPGQGMNKAGSSNTQMPYFTPTQYDQFLKKLNKEATTECSANMVGITCTCSVNASNQELLVDTGATNHMISNLRDARSQN